MHHNTFQRIYATMAWSGIAMAAFSLPTYASALGMITPWGGYSSAVTIEKPQTEKKQKLNALANHDVVILIDRSGSMETADCPAAVADSSDQSRWQWCCEQTQNLSAQTTGILKDGLRVVVFSTMQKTYDNVQLNNVPDIFQNNTPKGSTNIAVALKHQLDDYFRRKMRPEETKRPLKPLLIAVVTDGCFDRSIPVQRVITDATKRMDSPDEIAITFLQVGQDNQASHILSDLAAGKGNVVKRANYGIVSSKPFSELKKVGLTDALLDVVSSNNNTASLNTSYQ
jgi:hypothetical protein